LMTDLGDLFDVGPFASRACFCNLFHMSARTYTLHFRLCLV
jgi:hypothetical protein